MIKYWWEIVLAVIFIAGFIAGYKYHSRKKKAELFRDNSAMVDRMVDGGEDPRVKIFK